MLLPANVVVVRGVVVGDLTTLTYTLMLDCMLEQSLSTVGFYLTKLARLIF